MIIEIFLIENDLLYWCAIVMFVSKCNNEGIEIDSFYYSKLRAINVIDEAIEKFK